MDGIDRFGSPVQAADMCGLLRWESVEVKVRRPRDGTEVVKVRRRPVNRSTAYAFVDQLPDEFKSRIGTSIKINLTRLQHWLNEGGDREKAA